MSSKLLTYNCKGNCKSMPSPLAHRGCQMSQMNPVCPGVVFILQCGGHKKHKKIAVNYSRFKKLPHNSLHGNRTILGLILYSKARHSMNNDRPTYSFAICWLDKCCVLSHLWTRKMNRANMIQFIMFLEDLVRFALISGSSVRETLWSWRESGEKLPLLT